jgi:hypothetical protein
MKSRFEEILIELGTALEIELHPDHNGACKLSVSNAPSIQIEYNEVQQALLIASFLAEVPPGKFRENTFKTALKSNQEQPQTARLGFCTQTNQLALFQFIPIQSLTVTMLQTALAQFIDKAIAWKKGIETGDLLSLFTPSKSAGSGLFGIPK